MTPASDERRTTSARPAATHASAPSTLFHADFVVLLLVQMATGYAFATFFLLPKFMVEQLGSTPTEIGVVSAGFGVAGICAMPLVGPMLDRGGERRALVLGSGMLALSALLFVLVTSAGALPFVLRFVQGVSVAMVVNGGNLVVTKRAPAGRLAEAIGIYAAASLVMNAVAPVAAEIIAERYSYQLAFGVAGAAGLLSLALAGRVSKPTPRRVVIESSMFAMLQTPAYLRMAAILFAVGVGFGVMFTFGSLYALTLGMQNVRGFFVAFACSAVAVRVTMGRLVDAVGYRRVARGFLVLYGLTVLLMAGVAALRLVVVGAAFGFAHGVFMPTFTALMVKDCGEQERGRMLTLFNASFGVGHAAVVLLGPVAERFGYQLLFSLTGTLICFAPLLLLDSSRSKGNLLLALSEEKSS